jgi:hypothetical protein
MRKYSTLLKKFYDDDDSLVYVTNFVQCSKFLNNGATEELCDILYSGTRRPDTIVFVFKKTPLVKELYRKWQNHELD